MAAGVYDILIEQGATFRMSLVWKDSTGTPVNLTGYSARMQVRRTHKDPSTLLSFSTADGSIVLGGAAGTINITSSAAATANMNSTSGVYDLELVASDGTVTRLVAGSVTISPEVTR